MYCNNIHGGNVMINSLSIVEENHDSRKLKSMNIHGGNIKISNLLIVIKSCDSIKSKLLTIHGGNVKINNLKIVRENPCEMPVEDFQTGMDMGLNFHGGNAKINSLPKQKELTIHGGNIMINNLLIVNENHNQSNCKPFRYYGGNVTEQGTPLEMRFMQ